MEFEFHDAEVEDGGAADEVYHAEYEDAAMKFKDGNAKHQPLI